MAVFQIRFIEYELAGASSIASIGCAPNAVLPAGVGLMNAAGRLEKVFGGRVPNQHLTITR